MNYMSEESPVKTIPVKFTREQWVTVCNMLAEQPYKFCAPFIDTIRLALSKTEDE